MGRKGKGRLEGVGTGIRGRRRGRQVFRGGMRGEKTKGRGKKE